MLMSLKFMLATQLLILDFSPSTCSIHSSSNLRRITGYLAAHATNQVSPQSLPLSVHQQMWNALLPPNHLSPSSLLYLLTKAAVTNDHKLGGLKQQIAMVLVLEITTMLPLWPRGKNPSSSLPASDCGPGIPQLEAEWNPSSASVMAISVSAFQLPCS